MTSVEPPRQEKVLVKLTLHRNPSTTYSNHTACVTVRLCESNGDRRPYLSFVGYIYDHYGCSRVGQVVDTLEREFKSATTERLCQLWRRWHQNNWHAGCIHQREFEKEPYAKHKNDVCPICNHKYGASSVYEEIPQEVIDELKGLNNKESESTEKMIDQDIHHSGTQGEIESKCDELKAMLLEKNRKYGDSALNPCRVFSRANNVEQILVRIDDKLNRIRNRQNDEDEDVVMDLAGYLILLMIARKGQSHD